MASYMIVRHKVRDFSQWKLGYDAYLPQRLEAGLTEKYVLRGAEDLQQVILMFEVQDLNRAKAFAKAVDLWAAMQKAGVMDNPDVYFVTD